jgi:hypothetical protein
VAGRLSRADAWMMVYVKFQADVLTEFTVVSFKEK